MKERDGEERETCRKVREGERRLARNNRGVWERV